MTGSKRLWFILFVLIVGIIISIVPWLMVEAAPPEQGDPTPTPSPLVFDGIEFPHGEISFADRVVSYKAAEGVEAPYDNPDNALGLPDYDADAETGFVALGNAEETCQGELVLEFRDNVLVDIPGDDLWVFEIGPAVEATDVYISTDAQSWVSLGRVAGATRGVDIAGHITPGQRFNFVRLCDYPDGNSSPSPWGGPDIDAVGAIGTEPQPTPGPVQDIGLPVAPRFGLVCCLVGLVLVIIGVLVVVLLRWRRKDSQ